MYVVMRIQKWDDVTVTPSAPLFPSGKLQPPSPGSVGFLLVFDSLDAAAKEAYPGAEVVEVQFVGRGDTK